EGGNARIFIAVDIAQRPGIMVGELRREPLWGPADELPAATGFCVVEERSKRTLYCSDPVPAEVLQPLRIHGRSGFASATWVRDGETFRAQAWSQFMRAGFGTEDWLVVASQPEQYQLARVREFGNLYIPVVALTLLLVSWLAVRQGRDITEPVALLAARARRIANNEFGARAPIERADEFGQLSSAFDQMSERLGRQFASLSALSEIDRLILATQDTAQVVHTVLHRMGDAIPADVVSITLFDKDDDAHARTFFRPPEARDSVAMERHAAPEEERGALDADSRGKWIDLGASHAAPAYLAYAARYGITSAYVQPIVWRGAVCGALALGYRGAAALVEEERQQVRELSDRVAVAVSSAWRDDQLYQQSHFDALTGLPNRLLFKDRLEREIVRSSREAATFALLFIDIDHFKNVNDSFGHGEGDKVLREASRRVVRCVRESDTVSRLGGDEFTVLLTRLHHPQEAWLLAESVVAALSEEFKLGDERCFLSASVGISSFPADGASAEELLKSADTAMHRAKDSGRGQAVFFEEKMNRETVARVTLDRDLRAAIERGELVLHYQPQVDVKSGIVRGAEALIRWNHPKHGLVSPLRFIPLAEETGFIEQIGRFTFQRASAQLKEWRERGIALERVSVNVSPRQFRKRGLAEFIQRTVAEAGLPASCIEIEITEGLLLDRSEAVEGVLRELAERGHRIALDDFGTGFSSLAYLQRFPVHTIKVDRVFVKDLELNTDSEAIVAAIVAMSHALGKSVIAEGVETQGQLALLRKMNCGEVQGFLFAPALPPDEFVAFLAAQAKVLTLA
ncbi:MAG: EAL domain-containing protein, partial [Usitatibacter sp.]